MLRISALIRRSKDLKSFRVPSLKKKSKRKLPKRELRGVELRTMKK